MPRFAVALLVAATMAASAPGLAHAESRHAAPAAARPAAQHHSHAAPAHHSHVAPPSSRFVRPAAVYAPYGPVGTAYAPGPAYGYAPAMSARGPYFVVVGAGYTGPGLVYPAEANWNWTPVESVAALAGRAVAGRGDFRYYCPDMREYFPAVESCPSPWLKVIP